jgi:hypothetical protein
LKKGLEEAESGLKSLSPKVVPLLASDDESNVPEILIQARQLAVQSEKQNNFKVRS